MNFTPFNGCIARLYGDGDSVLALNNDVYGILFRLLSPFPLLLKSQREYLCYQFPKSSAVRVKKDSRKIRNVKKMNLRFGAIKITIFSKNR